MEDLSELKKLRKKLGLTQAQLAKRANVSQSLIAKIESGRLDPSYSKAKKIFETLAQLDKENDLTAKDIMHKKIISVKSSDSLKEAIIKMRKYNISQMPVIKHNKIMGYISESLLIDKLLKSNKPSLRVGEIMEQSPPIIPPETTKLVIANLLKHFPFVLVEDKGELKGIITKSDLLKAVYKS